MFKIKKYVVLPGITLALFFISAHIIVDYLKKENASKDRVTVACYRGDLAALIYITKQVGLFEKNGIEVIIKNYPAGKYAADSLIADNADIAVASDSTFVANSFKHRDLKVLAVISEGMTRKIVVREGHGIKKPADLRGKRVALVKGSADEYYLRHFLSLYNLKFSDIKIVNLEPDQIISKFIAGEVDAGIIRDLNSCQKENETTNKGIVWDIQLHKPFYFLLITKTKWVHDHPKYASSFIKALLQAEKIIAKDKNRLPLFFKKDLNYQSDCIKKALERNSYYVYLPQALLFEFENQAFWRIENQLTKEKKVPNYLDFIYPYALDVADPQRVNLIR
ncbi:MAG: NrtA/SsuA/CpmA family ABC transporter substrate-binding protein [Candidatus Omnitrophica bacterium]|nr:NrtA/SsuA/CpmA family ABC transporter substrate-binding protein [Candidatus Omnitrophota bacterium]